MKHINSLAILFLLAFAVGLFVFISRLFSEEEEKSTSDYRVKVKEITINECSNKNSENREVDS